MMRRSRVGTTVDIARLGHALARPGMDTRVWASVAFAADESFYDQAEGVFIDVVLAPSGQELTARVPADYAGDGFGFYARIHKHDELLVVIPNGDPAEGAVVVSRLWSKADPPPADGANDPDEVMLVVEKDKHLRIRTSGSGKIEIDAEADVTVKTSAKAYVEAETVTLKTEKVRLGEETASEQVVLGTVFRQKQVSMDTNLAIQFGAAGGALSVAGPLVAAAGAALSAAAADPILLSLCPVAAAMLTVAGASLTAAGPSEASAGAMLTQASGEVTTFETGALSNQNYLSNVSKTKR